MEEPAAEDTKPSLEQLAHEDFDPNIKIKQEKNLTPPPTEPTDDPAPPEADEDEKKPTEPVKSSKELLAELFSVFNAVPPEILLDKDNDNQEDSDSEKKSKKKKRHKEKKDKKHKKKKKSDHDEDSKDSKHAKKRIKEEKHKDRADKHDKHSTERSIKIESVSGKQTKDGQDMTNIEITMSRTQRIQIKNLKNSLVLESRSHKDEGRERRRHQHRTGDSDFSMSDVEETVTQRSKSAERRQRHKQHEDFDRFYASYNDHSWQTKDQDRSGRRHEVKKERPERRELSRDRREAARPRWDERSHREEWSRGRKRSRSRSRSGERIDKKRLLEIARKNAIHMLRNGSLPGSSGLAPEAKDKIIANLKCTGKSVQELTDYCKKISEGDLEDLSNLSGEDSDHDRDGNSRAFHHPFVLKEREPIVMNIRVSFGGLKSLF
jgi:protein SON